MTRLARPHSSDPPSQVEHSLILSEAPERLARCFQAFRPELIAGAMRICSDLSEAEDSVQEAFLHVFDNLSRYAEPPTGWLALARLVVRRQALNRQRDELKFARGTELDFIPHRGASADEELCAESIRIVLTNTLAKLPRMQWGIFVLHRCMGRTIAETAESFDVAPQTVKNNVSIVLRYLDEALNAAGHEHRLKRPRPDG